MSYQQCGNKMPARETGYSLNQATKVFEKTEGIEATEQYHVLVSCEGTESTADGVSHLREEANQSLDLSAIRRSESPLFEPMHDTASMKGASMFNTAYDIESEAGHSSPPHTTSLDGLKRARTIKSQLSNSLKILRPKSMRVRNRTVEEDPDNQAIKKMRQVDHMSWDAIVAQLNKERLKRGEPQTWTCAAVYSRFVRNAPRIAAAQGEVGFDPSDYMYLRNPTLHPGSEVPGAINNPSGYHYGAGGGRKRVRNGENAAKDLADNLRHNCAETLSEQAKLLEESGMTELMMEAVATVEQHFWAEVANTLERQTGKLFDRKVLESRYHTIKW